MSRPSVAVWRGTGYAARELIGLLLRHPSFHLARVTSASRVGVSVAEVHPSLAGLTGLSFFAPATENTETCDAVLFAGRHGEAAEAISALLNSGYGGIVVDLSADFRLRDADAYFEAHGAHHPSPQLLRQFVYGLPELDGDQDRAGKYWIANPGCFATGLALALAPVAAAGIRSAAVTALTGASGSGITPRKTTHFPDRFGSVRAYKVLDHQHLAEVRQEVPGIDIAFVPVSGPWSRGIWGTAVCPLDGVSSAHVADSFHRSYRHRPFVRLRESIPELGPVVGTPFCDIGWVVRDETLVVGFALDNLLKGAASQAIQNLNLAFGLDETLGLLPDRLLETA